MFAVVRTGGKQYRVAPGDKIVVEKLSGETGDRFDITDILLAGSGSDLQSVEGLTVGAEIIAQAKADKVTVFKKRRRHNYRRKKGHRQQHTILKILSIGDHKAEDRPANATETAPTADVASASVDAPDVRGQTDVGATENPAPASETASTIEAAPAKGARKKAPKA